MSEYNTLILKCKPLGSHAKEFGISDALVLADYTGNPFRCVGE